MFKFEEDERVVLVSADNTDLPIGTMGTVFCTYATNPPAYEVNFDLGGDEYASIVYEADLKAAEERPALAVASASGVLTA